MIGNWAVASNAEILADIHQEHTNIAIYDRNINCLEGEIKDLIDAKFEVRLSGETEFIISSIESELKAYKFMIEDISTLLRLFKEHTKANNFRLLLITVSNNMCRKFHTDVNDLRMLCTYSGPGTLWLTEDNVNRKALDTCGDNECIVLDETKIQQARTGTIVLLKGAIYPKDGTKAIVHRSPTIEETGQKRLLLRIDTNQFLNFE